MLILLIASQIFGRCFILNDANVRYEFECILILCLFILPDLTFDECFEVSIFFTYYPFHNRNADVQVKNTVL